MYVAKFTTSSQTIFAVPNRSNLGLIMLQAYLSGDDSQPDFRGSCTAKIKSLTTSLYLKSVFCNIVRQSSSPYKAVALIEHNEASSQSNLEVTVFFEMISPD